MNYKDGYDLAQKNGMMFFETSAKTSNNINLMMLTAISKLPFFSQFEIEPENLIKELENLNCKNTKIIPEKNEDLKMKGEEGKPTKIIIKRKKNCAC